jgi:guanine deaminase
LPETSILHVCGIPHKLARRFAGGCEFTSERAKGAAALMAPAVDISERTATQNGREHRTDLTPDELMEEACRLAAESVRNNWGGPFGAVIARGGEIIARGQNRVLLTGDITAHAEVEAIRKAAQVLNAQAPSIAKDFQNASTLELVPRPEGSPDPVPERARMLMGMSIYISGAPCPMCMSAIYWARIDTVRFACDLEATSGIGFDDAFQYEDFGLPLSERRIDIAQFRPDLGATAYKVWADKADKHPY